MEGYRFRYVSMGHSVSGVGLVGVNFEREEGVQFTAVLTVEDAKRLLEDMPEQIRIADPHSN